MQDEDSLTFLRTSKIPKGKGKFTKTVDKHTRLLYNMYTTLTEENIDYEKIDGLLLDLGVSSYQLTSSCASRTSHVSLCLRRGRQG